MYCKREKFYCAAIKSKDMSSGGAAPPKKPTSPTQRQRQIQQLRTSIRRFIDTFDPTTGRGDIMDVMDYYRELRRLRVPLTDDEINDLRMMINKVIHDGMRIMYRGKFIRFVLQNQRQIIREIITLERDVAETIRRNPRRSWTADDMAYVVRAAWRIDDMNLLLRYLEYLRDRYWNSLYVNTEIDAVRELLRMDDKARRRHLLQARRIRDKRSIIDKAVQLQRGRSTDQTTGGGGGSIRRTQAAAASQQQGGSVDSSGGAAQTRRSRRSHSDSDIIISRPAAASRTRSLSLSSSRTGQGPLRRQQSPLQQYINRIPDRVDPSLRTSVAQHVLDRLNSDLFTQLTFLFGEPRKKGGAAQQKKKGT